LLFRGCGLSSAHTASTRFGESGRSVDSRFFRDSESAFASARCDLSIAGHNMTRVARQTCCDHRWVDPYALLGVQVLVKFSSLAVCVVLDMSRTFDKNSFHDGTSLEGNSQENVLSGDTEKIYLSGPPSSTSNF